MNYLIFEMAYCVLSCERRFCLNNKRLEIDASKLSGNKELRRLIERWNEKGWRNGAELRLSQIFRHKEDYYEIEIYYGRESNSNISVSFDDKYLRTIAEAFVSTQGAYLE